MWEGFSQPLENEHRLFSITCQAIALKSLHQWQLLKKMNSLN